MDLLQSVWLTWNGTPIGVQARPWEGWEMYPMWGMGGAWGFGMMLMMLVFGGLVIAGLVLGIRWLVKQGREPQHDAALEILRQRYARGEIDRELYVAKERDLKGGAGKGS